MSVQDTRASTWDKKWDKKAGQKTHPAYTNQRAKGSPAGHNTAWHQAVEAWLLEHGFFEVLQPKKVLRDIQCKRSQMTVGA